MLHLFGPKETDFINGDSDLIHHTYDEVVDRSKGFYLKFKVTLDKDEQYKKVKKEMIISAYTPDGWNQFRVFDIYNYSNHVEVVATQLHYDLNYKKVFPFNVKNTTAQTALNVFVSNFKSDLPNFTFTSTITDTHDFSTDDDLERLEDGHNALEILNRMAARWGGELDVNGYNVRLVPKLGKFTNALLYEHKNISEFVDETSMSEIITRIHAVSRFRPERVEGSEDEPEEVTIQVVVDSPLINEYAQVYEEDYTNNDARTRDELIAWARLKYSTNSVDKPARSIKVETNIIDGQEINYGDDLVLKYTKHDVDEIIRCVGYQYNPNSKQYISVTLGSNLNTLSSTITGRVHDSTKNQLSNMEKQVQIVRYAANDKNRATAGPLPIPDPIEGDIWFYHPEGRPNEVELRIYRNGGWETIVNDMTGENIRKTIDAMELVAEGLAEEIAASDQKAAAALEEAGISNNLAQTAKDLADTAKTDAQSAISIAQSAIGEASKALTASQNAESLVGTVMSDASQARASANTAKTNAQTALENAQTALTEAGGAKITVNSLTTRVDEVEGELELKASQTSVDGISDTVSTHSTTLLQHATQLSSKAESSLVNTIKGTVDTHTTEISQNASDIVSKASASSVNTLTGRVDTAESNISQNATAINARLTSSQVNSLVDGKGFATQTWANNQITATANGIKSNMTRVEGKIDGLEIGGRNYALGTTDKMQYYQNVGLYTGPLIPNNTSKNVYTLSELGARVGDAFTASIYIGGGGYGSGLRIDNQTGTTQYNSPIVTNGYSSVTFTVRPQDSEFRFYLRNANNFSSTYQVEASKFKIEKGNKRTDWTPAPEDTMMENDFKVFKSEYESTAQSLSSRLTAIDKVGGRLSTAESLISQNAEAIEERLTTAQVNILVDGKGLVNATYVNNQITKTAEGITSEITRVEGKIPQNYTEENLVLNSKERVSNKDYLIKEYDLTKELTVGKEYTIVLEGGIGLTGRDQQFGIYFDNGGSRQGVLQNVVNNIYKATFTLLQTGLDSGDKSKFRLYNLPNNTTSAVIKWIKLVEGKAKDNTYRPSMNELLMENDFTVFKNTTEDTIEAINTELSKTAKTTDLNGMVTESVLSAKNYVTAGTMSSTLSNYAQTDNVPTNTQFNTLKNRYDSMEQTIGTNGNKIARMVMTDSVYQTSIRKGGRNLLKDSYRRIANGDRFHSSFDVKDPIPHGTKVTLSFKASSGGNQIVQIYNTNSYYNYGDVKFTRGTTPHVYHLTFTMNTHSNGGPAIDENNQQIRFFNKLEPNPGAWIILRWAVLQYGEIGTEHYISDDEDFETQVTQLENSWALRLKSGDDIKTQINATTSGIRLQGKTIHLDGNTTMNNAFARSLMVDKLEAADVTAFTGKFHAVIANNIDVNNISGAKSTFLQSAWPALNSRAVVDGVRIRIESGIQGAFVELNNIPEFRSQHHDGTGVVMAKGRVQFFEPNGGSQGYIGRDIHTGTNDFGIFISRGKGWRLARATDASSSTGDKYYTVKSGMSGRVAIVEDMVRLGILPDGGSTQFVNNSNKIAQLNGWPILPKEWPTQRVGDQILYEKGKIINEGATGVSYEDVINFGMNGALTAWWIYMRQHVRYEAGYSSSSDRRIKHNIQPTSIVAVDAISALSFKEFKMNKDDRYVPLGLIAQESGLLRIEDPVNEALNMELATMLSLKGVQELHRRIKELEEEIKTLKENNT